MQTSVKPTASPPEMADEGSLASAVVDMPDLSLQMYLARSRHGSHAGSQADMCQAHCKGAWPLSGLAVAQQPAVTL